MGNDITWSVDGWTGYQGLVVPDDLGVDWFVQSTQGWWNGTGIRNNDQDKTGSDGTFYSPPDRAARVVTITGYATCPDDGVMELAMDRFNALLSDRRQLHTLAVGEQTRTRQADVHLGDAPIVDPIGYSQFDYQLTVVAPDVRKLNGELHQVSGGMLVEATGGTQWDGPAGTTGVQWDGPAAVTGVQWESGSGNSGIIQLTNAGTADAPIQFFIDGPVISPSLVDIDTDRTLTYPDLVAAGQTLAIDTGTESVRLDGANRRPQMTRADFFLIPAGGTLTVAFRGPAPDPAALLTAQWRDAWL